MSLLAPSCGKDPAPAGNVAVQKSALARDTAPSVPEADAAQLAADDQAFAVDLFQALRAEPGNLVYSPTSLSLALAMLYNGAANGTAAEMADAVHFSLPVPRLNAAFDAMDLALTASPPAGGSGAFQLSIANSLWTQRGFAVQGPFLDALAVNYGAGVNNVDFQNDAEHARADINQWVSDATRGEIPDLFPPRSIDASTVLVLADAVFFHGDWQTPFPAHSADGTFHAPAGDVTVPMMVGDGNAQIAKGTGWSAATLAYAGGTTDMVLVVPDAGTFDAFEQALTTEQLAAILNATNSSGAVTMPKFKFRYQKTLNQTLAALGMPAAFTGAADFSGIDGAMDLIVQTVVHQADIAVDEQGTTAAAATGIGVGRLSIQEQLVVDRPFLFFIVHPSSGAILFAGRVVDPTT
ncbi:MAG TPA: serpin family protein [Polyangia bacterium]|nr:serpin family protein [Polyangia bacterium]